MTNLKLLDEVRYEIVTTGPVTGTLLIRYMIAPDLGDPTLEARFVEAHVAPEPLRNPNEIAAVETMNDAIGNEFMALMQGTVSGVEFADNCKAAIRLRHGIPDPPP